MKGIMTTASPWAPRILSVVRAVFGLLYFLHGTQKIFEVPFNKFTQGIEPWTLNWFAGMMETIGGPLILFGLFTRPVAFLLSGEMAIAYFLRYAKGGLFPVTNGGEIPTLYCFIFFYLAFAGAGEWSLDAMLARRSRPAV
jgi:putative oxidoreductase